MDNEQEYRRMQAKQQKAYAAACLASSGLFGFSHVYPRTSLVVVIATFILCGIFLWNLPDKSEENAAWWRANLKCQQSGDDYKYFGTEGYHCIGGRRQQ